MRKTRNFSTCDFEGFEVLKSFCELMGNLGESVRRDERKSDVHVWRPSLKGRIEFLTNTLDLIDFFSGNNGKSSIGH